MNNKPKFGMSSMIIIGIAIAVFGALVIGIALAVGLLTKIKILFYLLGLVGFTIFLSGLSVLFSELKVRMRMRALVEKGIPYRATITAIEENKGVSIKGKHPVHVLCEYRDPELDTSHVYRGFDMQSIPASAVGKTVTVYVDREGSSQYYIDLSPVLSDR